MELPLLKYWILMVSVLFFKGFLLALYQVWLRLRYQLYAADEDKPLFIRFAIKGAVDSAPAKVRLERTQKCWQNDLESIPLFLFLSLGFVLLNQDHDWGILYMTVFLLARIAHTVFYIAQRQPFRGIAWDTSAFTSVFIAIHSALLAW